jgi:hypothetical protein
MTRLVATSTVPQGPFEEGLAWVGRTLGPAPCPTRVDAGHVRMFAALTRDPDPRWWREGWDDDVVEVPPGLLMSYALPPLWHPDGVDLRPLWARIPLPGATLINVSTRTEHLLPLYTGRRLTLTERVVAVSPLRQTRVGPGHFVTTEMEFADGETVVARHENVMLRYSLDESIAVPPALPADPVPDAVVEVRIPVTLEQCVLDVVATQDLFPGHYDREYAQQQRVGGVFLNTMFFQGVADWLALQAAGPDHRVVRRDLQMRGSAAEGDQVEAGARPPRVEAGRTVVEVEINASGRRAAHAVVEVASKEEPR